MNYFCSNSETIIALLTSGIIGLAGQTLYIGLSLCELKLKSIPVVETADLSNPRMKLWGLFLGFFVGVALTLTTYWQSTAFTLEQVIAIIAAGYTSTDLLELHTTKAMQIEMNTGEAPEFDTNKQQLIITVNFKHTVKS